MFLAGGLGRGLARGQTFKCITLREKSTTLREKSTTLREKSTTLREISNTLRGKSITLREMSKYASREAYYSMHSRCIVYQ